MVIGKSYMSCLLFFAALLMLNTTNKRTSFVLQSQMGVGASRRVPAASQLVQESSSKDDLKQATLARLTELSDVTSNKLPLKRDISTMSGSVETGCMQDDVPADELLNSPMNESAKGELCGQFLMPEKGERIHCDKCTKSFAKKETARNHMISEHRITMYPTKLSGLYTLHRSTDAELLRYKKSKEKDRIKNREYASKRAVINQ
jgi:hypothetical protein